MTKQVEFLWALLLVSGVLSIVYSVLEPKKVIKLNTWYYILRDKRDAYDFNITVKRTKLAYYYFTVLSAFGVTISFINQEIGEWFVWISFLSLIFSLYYSYPVKIHSDTDTK